MKSRLGLVLLCGTLASSCWGAALPGDANGDGKITPEDARVILQRSVSAVLLGAEQEQAADFNGDGVVDSLDAVLVLRAAGQQTGVSWDGFRAVAGLEDSGVRCVLSFAGSSARIEAPMEVRLLDLAGQVLSVQSATLTSVAEGRAAEVVFKISDVHSVDDLVRYVIEIRGWSEGQPVRERFSLYAVTPRLSACLLGPSVLTPGAVERVRVVAQSAPANEPVAGARVDLSLRKLDQVEAVHLLTGWTDAGGQLDVMFEVPADELGKAELTARVQSDLGETILTQEADIEEGLTTLLTTDKPIYQPGQTIHLRTLTLRKPARTPASGSEIVMTVADAKGNKVFRQTRIINEFGVASADFTLATELNLGPYTIAAAVGDISVDKQVTVSRYVLPKFKVAVETDAAYYVPGATLQGDIAANYFFGKPVAGGSVRVTASKFDVGFQPFAEIAGTTDPEGNFHFELDLPAHFVGQPLNQGEAFVLLEAAIIDGAGHEQTATLSLPVTASDLLILAVPESGQLVPEVSNRIYLLTTYPNKTPAQTTCDVSVGGEWVASVETDASGIALVEFTPVGVSDILMSVDARDAQGNRTIKALALPLTQAPESILLRTDRTLYTVGDTIQADVWTSGPGGSVYADVVKDGRTLFSRILQPQQGHASVVIPLSPEMSGTLALSVYRITGGTDTVRDRKLLYVDPANDLRLSYAPDQDTYLPGQAAKIRMRVTDADDRPVVAAIGLSIVDEAVFALQELQPGMEKVYFYLEEQLRTPRYEIHGFEPSVIVGQPLEEVLDSTRDRALGLLFASLDSVSPAGGERAATTSGGQDEWSLLRDALADALWADLRPFFEGFNRELTAYEVDRSSAFFDPLIAAATEAGRLTEEAARDPWNSIYRVSYERTSDRFTFGSAGPDKAWGTSDDLSVVAESWIIHNMWIAPNPDWQWLQPLAGGPDLGVKTLGGMALVSGEDVDWLWFGLEDAVGPPNVRGGEAGEGGEPYLRQYFPETLYNNPLIITGPDGEAEIGLDMADSITSWRLTGLASSADGRLGSGTAATRTFQEFFVDLDLPPTLTRGDEVSIPVAVYNYLPGAQDIRVLVHAADWFELMDDSEKTLTLEANQVDVTSFRIKTLRVGRHRLQVTAYGSERSDALAREIEVVPDGKEILVTHAGRLSGTVDKMVSIPLEAIDGASKVLVKIYPGLFSQVVEGLDSMLRMPFGCFEQTSSVTYPNVLAVDYMKTTGQITPEILMKAEGFISAGYQRLLSYEVEGGGFEWFGNAPAHNVLTTYGLMEFSDMRTVWYVDPAVILRTQEWLVGDQEPDGSWIPTGGGIAEGAINRYQNDVLRTTAYVVWGLTASGYAGPAVDAGIAYLKARLADPELSTETYTLALCAHACLLDPGDPLLPALFAEFEQRKQSDGDLVWWSDDAPTMTYSTGRGADVELTALLAQAYMRSGFYPETVTKALNYLVSAKDGGGNFGSTQATVLALRAFCMAAAGVTQPPEATVRVSINGSAPVALELNEQNGDLLHLVDLQNETVEGDNAVQLTFEGTGSSLYQIVGRYYLPWTDIDPPAEELIGIDIDYDRTELAVNDTVTCRVRIANHRPGLAKMVVIDVGVPPGFDIITDDLDALVGSQFQKYQIAGRQVIFYLDELNHDVPVEFSYRLVARYPIRAKTPASVVYEYYTPEIRAESEPQELVVVE